MKYPLYSSLLLALPVALVASEAFGDRESLLKDNKAWYLTDTHIHALPPGYKNAVADAGGDPSGFHTPDWSEEGTLESLNLTGSARAVLSVSTPGIPIAGTGQQARDLCRETNDYLAELVNKHPLHLDFFAVLPDWRDVNGTLEEIDYIYSTQKQAVGVTLYTSYGDLLPGDAMFKPIWDKLESYGALAFMHPGTMNVKPFFIGGFLPQPIIDYPQQTTRAAMDLVISGVRSNTPNVDLILSHAGGTLPFLAQRAYGGLIDGDVSKNSSVDAAEALVQFKRFYYDTALSNSPAQLSALLYSVDPSHILLGTDYPYVPAETIKANFEEYIEFLKTHPAISTDVLTQNAMELVLKHALWK
ncbi:amidohydrolase family protein [Aspergillus glaucus CBS 516.65]|uniref:6-methylsalicylate decarboxylase n=1 Tax=Aspergillus glaucus CBS 516.65 TaxID=1160497 RepID=A0A1L9V7D0_ASPGL|nr:hypothetical protein ASPGLDRAFT_52355 [Aspergillus glaucus CBS 516.65]OJJ79816.1 hypothetical protein ASPGLDRAFT_52355 [Aspergillus glaucus CBS 516.65]